MPLESDDVIKPRDNSLAVVVVEDPVGLSPPPETLRAPLALEEAVRRRARSVLAKVARWTTCCGVRRCCREEEDEVEEKEKAEEEAEEEAEDVDDAALLLLLLINCWKAIEPTNC